MAKSTFNDFSILKLAIPIVESEMLNLLDMLLFKYCGELGSGYTWILEHEVPMKITSATKK